MYLFQKVDVYSPDLLEKKDVLVIHDKIVSIADDIDPSSFPFPVTVVDGKERLLVPGFVDGHQHFTGGGGEGGYSSKVSEMTIEMNVAHGVTTAVGLLGTDAISRSVENLYAKTESFNEQGLSAYMLTGSYWLPSPTITGSVATDLAFIKPIIGLKLAISDHRGPYLTVDDIARVAQEVKLSAMISNKPGFITLHTGGLSNGLKDIIHLIRDREFAANLFLPTHINRRNLFEQVIEMANLGSTVDATAQIDRADKVGNKMNAADLAKEMKTLGLLDQLTISSDAGGSLPIWNEDRTKMIGMGVGTPESLLFELKLMVNDYQFDLSEALKPFTTTPACYYGLGEVKGQIKAGYDADLIMLDRQLDICEVYCRGQRLFQKKA